MVASGAGCGSASWTVSLTHGTALSSDDRHRSEFVARSRLSAGSPQRCRGGRELLRERLSRLASLVTREAGVTAGVRTRGGSSAWDTDTASGRDSR
jgi:hypothetical protein